MEGDNFKVKGKRIAVLGLGVEGVSSALFLAKQAAKVTVLDEKEEKDINLEFLGEIKRANISIIYGKDAFEGLDKFDIVVRSPGVHVKRIKNQESRIKNNLTSQTKIFFDLCPCKIIGVTGTKGKGTTSSLIYEMLKKEGKDVYLGGNIGNPVLKFLDKLTPQSIVVLEMSSFQLQDLTRSPHVGVILMITQEHLDYHNDVHEYVDAKRNILRFQSNLDFAVINKDYPASRESDIETWAKVFQVSREGGVAQGCFVRDGKIIVRFARGFPELANPTTLTETEIIDTKDILLPGKHNLENVCAAVMAATIAGVSKKNIIKVLREFRGLEHRLELAGTFNEASYYDDSFSTTPETAIAAIQSFTNPEILILGGSSKHSDFSQLGQVIASAKNIKAIIGIGAEWQRIKSKINPPAGGQKSKILIVEGAKDMHQIVLAASKIAQRGDVVLLSPACASFDMFKNYKDRGEQFKEEVISLMSS